MSNDASDKSAGKSPFDVFRSDGSTRLPGQRFPSTGPATTPRSGPIDQRVITDATGGPIERQPERSFTQLRGADAAAQIPENVDSDPVTIRIQTVRIDLAERIAKVKAEQKEALDHLRQLGDEPFPGESADDTKNPAGD
jgi:hypothetical protein